jgi:hypothetical protein
MPRQNLPRLGLENGDEVDGPNIGLVLLALGRNKNYRTNPGC